MDSAIGTWPGLLSHLVAGNDLSARDTAWAMNLIMVGEATPARIAAFVVALRAKGETPAEVRGMADAMFAHAHKVHATGRAMDVVGTGGDRAGTVNISTMTSLVLAASGATVVKHGNRAASSKCGTADVLETLGVAIDLPADGVSHCAEELGIGFCFAALFHPAMKHAGPTRGEIGIPTAFNLLGPLTNPARPSAGLVGCADARMAPVMANVFATRGDCVLVVRGDDGLDEVTTTTTTTAWIVHEGAVREDRIDPSELGVALSSPQDLQGGNAHVNAEAVRQLLAGQRGPVRDAVLLNTAAGLVAYDEPEGNLHDQMRRGIDRAADAIDSGRAAELLRSWATRSTELKAALK